MKGATVGDDETRRLFARRSALEGVEAPNDCFAPFLNDLSEGGGLGLKCYEIDALVVLRCLLVTLVRSLARFLAFTTHSFA